MNVIELRLNDIIPFGKWKGMSVNNIIPEEDDGISEVLSVFGRGDGLSYLEWMNNTCENIKLMPDVIQRMKNLENYEVKIMNLLIKWVVV